MTISSFVHPSDQVQVDHSGTSSDQVPRLRDHVDLWRDSWEDSWIHEKNLGKCYIYIYYI